MTRVGLIGLVVFVTAFAGCTEALEDVKDKATNAITEAVGGEGEPDWSSAPKQSAGGDETEDDLGNSLPSPEMSIEYDSETRTVKVTEFEFQRDLPWVLHNHDDIPDDHTYMRLAPHDGGCEEVPSGTVSVEDTIVCDPGTKLNIDYFAPESEDDGKGGSVSMFLIEFDSDDEPIMESPTVSWDRDQPGKFVLESIEWNGGDIVWAASGDWDEESDRWAFEFRITSGTCAVTPSGNVGSGDAFECDEGTSLTILWRDAVNDEADNRLLAMKSF